MDGVRSFAVPKEPVPRLRTLRWAAAQPDGAVRHRCFLARNGIYHGIGALGLRPGDRVLVPAYICRAAVDPIVARGIDVDFYRVGPACEVDFADITSRLGPNTRALLIVHYFGFPQDMQAVTAFCRRNGLYLIEDCAHVFGALPHLELGKYGDISVFSWRKFLPVYDGGDLLVKTPVAFTPRWDAEGVLFTMKVAKNLFDQWATRHVWLAPMEKAIRVAKRAVLARAAASSGATAAFAADPGSLDFDRRLAALPMSRLSRWLLRHSDPEWVAARRRDNYRKLADGLKSLNARSLVPELPEGVCPWIYPVLAARPNAHLELRRRGIPAVTWGGVRPAALIAVEHPEAERLYDHLLFLPVHQDLDAEAIERTADAMRAVVG